MLLSAKPETIVKAMIPKTSSITAAAKIAFPLSVFIAPISFKVSTVIPTEVAVKITPKNKFSIQASGPTLYIMPIAYPIARGTKTPNTAITNAFKPAFFRSVILVSRPAPNIKTITPISDKVEIRLLGCTKPKTAGPNKIPASKAPTTAGIRNFRENNPKTFVPNKIRARSNR